MGRVDRGTDSVIVGRTTCQCRHTINVCYVIDEQRSVLLRIADPLLEDCKSLIDDLIQACLTMRTDLRQGAQCRGGVSCCRFE